MLTENRVELQWIANPLGFLRVSSRLDVAVRRKWEDRLLDGLLMNKNETMEKACISANEAGDRSPPSQTGFRQIW